MVARKMRPFAFSFKILFLTYFDSKHIDNTLETLLNQFMIFKNLINHHKTQKHRKIKFFTSLNLLFEVFSR
jgi:hypothetical protein